MKTYGRKRKFLYNFKSLADSRDKHKKTNPLIKGKVDKFNYTKIINLNTTKHLKQNLKDKSQTRGIYLQCIQSTNVSIYNT